MSESPPGAGRGDPRAEMVRYMRALAERGLNTGCAGNGSVRVPEGLLITPSGLLPEELRAQDLIVLSPAGEAPPGGRRPSSEWRLHCRILERRPEANAVLHAHPPYATALACARRDLPAFHYMLAVAGGASVRCADYATFGTEALAGNVLRALRGRRACLMANHGALSLGPDLRAAYLLLLELENLCRQYWLSLQVGAGPALLSAAQMEEALERFRDYRRPGPAEPDPEAPDSGGS